MPICTVSVLKTYATIASCADHFVFTVYCQKRRFPFTTAMHASSAHNIEFDNARIRTRPTLPPCSRGQMVAGFSAGRVPINVRSAPSAPFRFGYEYTNIFTEYLASAVYGRVEQDPKLIPSPVSCRVGNQLRGLYGFPSGNRITRRFRKAPRVTDIASRSRMSVPAW